MSIPRLCITTLTFVSLLAVILGHGQAAMAQNRGDLLVSADENLLRAGPLPRGSAEMPRALERSPGSMTFGADGRLYIRYSAPSGLGPRLARLEADGQLNDVVDLSQFLEQNEFASDITVDSVGRFYLLTTGFTGSPEFEIFQRVIVLEGETFERVAEFSLPQTNRPPFEHLEFSGHKFWLVDTTTLSTFDPLDGSVEFSGFDLFHLGLPAMVSSVAADSTGALWIRTVTEPDQPDFRSLYRLDPATGALEEKRVAQPLSFGPIAIHRRCQNDDTHRCLQGGRFRVRLDWRSFTGDQGAGRVAPNGSADSTLFWFFDAANYELLVKVLDGCDNNGHFWVFAGATTDVAFDLFVEDLETGEEWRFENPLGNPPRTINDTFAFSGCPREETP